MTKQQVLRIQGTYYIATGLWPLVSMRSFETLTGPKVDKWLVQMVGLLAAAIGVTLLIGARDDGRIDRAVFTLATISALSFTGIDITHALRRRISPIYLGDAVCELMLISGLLSPGFS